jgi:hypothetical protein
MCKIIITMAALLVIVASPGARAGAILHIGSGYNTPCQTGGCPLYNGETNGFDTGLDIYMNSNGAPALVDPVLLILGVPNTTASNPLDGTAVTQASIVDGPTGTKTAITFNFGTMSFGLGGSGFAGLMSTGDEVYDVLGLGGANSSNSYKNWSQWDLAVNGIAATNFGLYVFAFDPGDTALADFAAEDFIDITVSGIPQGTFAVAYGVDTSGKTYSTAFTEAGLMNHTPRVPPRVPEPMTLALVGIGLVGLGLSMRGKPA